MINKCNPARKKALKPPWIALILSTAIITFWQFLCIGFVQDFGWDDGAITLAFSRTLSEHGVIALTPVSDPVEGYSSTMWMGLMALAHKAINPGFSEFIRLSQFGSAFFSILGSILFYILLLETLKGQVFISSITTITLFSSAPFTTESTNGMEMNLAAFLALLIGFLIKRLQPACQSSSQDKHLLLLLSLASGIACLNRLEVLFYLSLAAIALIKIMPKASYAIALGGWSFSLINELHRISYFGEVLPNTILAKRWQPYKSIELRSLSSITGRFKDSLAGFVEIFKSQVTTFTCIFAIWILVRLKVKRVNKALFTPTQGFRSSPFMLYCFGYTAGTIVFSTATGVNWGHIGRMQMSALPLLILIAFDYLNKIITQEDSRRLKRLVFLASLVALLIRPFPGPINAIKRGFAHSYQGQPIGAEGYGSTPAELGATGYLFEQIRNALDLSTITVAIPDVGGTSLRSPRTRILDTGLLTSKELARNGYQGLPALLEREKPDIIETHGIWSKVSGIYTNNFFKDNYVPIIANNTWLYLHKSHLAKILDLTQAELPTKKISIKYRGYPFDEEFIARNYAYGAAAAIYLGDH